MILDIIKDGLDGLADGTMAMSAMVARCCHGLLLIRMFSAENPVLMIERFYFLSNLNIMSRSSARYWRITVIVLSNNTTHTWYTPANLQ